MNPYLPAALAGFGGYLIYEHFAHPNGAPAPGIPTTTTTSKFAPVGTLSQPAVSKTLPKLSVAASPVGGSVPKSPWLVPNLFNGGSSNWAKATNGATGQLLDTATAKIKNEYDKLSGEAKKKAADELNKLIKPSPGLTGNESFTDASKKVGAALGTAIGGSLGSIVPGVGTATAAALGAIAGAYLGEELGPDLQKAWDKVESWSKNAANKVKDAVENEASKLAHEAEDEAKKAWDTVTGWL